MGDQFGPKLRADPRLHGLGYVRDFLFAGSSSAPAVSSLSASLLAAVSPPLLPSDKSVGGPKEEVARPPMAWRPAESSAPASAAAHVKGEKECAVTPLFLWHEGQPGKPLGSLLSLLFRGGVKNPLIKVASPSGSVDSKSICFPYTTKCPNAAGCDGTMPKRGNPRQRTACNCLHICLSKAEWQRAGKDTYRPVWDFLQLDVVKDYLVPSDEFWQLME